VDVSVILPFGDDEDRVGVLSRRVAEHLRELGLAFEILAVDEGSGDNSVALLSILRGELPELKLVHGMSDGVLAARGRTLWVVDHHLGHDAGALAPFATAERRVSAGEADVVAAGRFLVARRTRAWPVLERAKGRGEDRNKSVLRAAAGRKLRVLHLGT
jgi:dolichol-phosphate mannosyltransferase